MYMHAQFDVYLDMYISRLLSLKKVSKRVATPPMVAWILSAVSFWLAASRPCFCIFSSTWRSSSEQLIWRALSPSPPPPHPAAAPSPPPPAKIYKKYTIKSVPHPKGTSIFTYIRRGAMHNSSAYIQCAKNLPAEAARGSSL